MKLRLTWPQRGRLVLLFVYLVLQPWYWWHMWYLLSFARMSVAWDNKWDRRQK